MKKTMGIILVLIGVVALAACGSKSVNKIKEEDLMALSVIGGVNDIKFNLNSDIIRIGSEIDESFGQDAIENKEYLELMLNLMNEQSYSSEIIESDNEDYEHLLIIKVNQEELKYYYNEQLVKEEIDKDEEEKEYVINGIIISDDVTYTVTGKKSIETETDSKDNEVENELELELKIMLDQNNYSLIKYEEETEEDLVGKELEKELVFRTYVNGKRVSEMSIDIEVENNEVEIELVLKENKNQYKYKFKNNGKNKAVIKYEFKQDGKTNKGTINVKTTIDENGKIIYEF